MVVTEYTLIVMLNDLGHVPRAVIAGLYSVAVKNGMELRPSWKVSVDERQEFLTDACFNIPAERRVEPNHFSRSLTTSLLGRLILLAFLEVLSPLLVPTGGWCGVILRRSTTKCLPIAGIIGQAPANSGRDILQNSSSLKGLS